MKAHEVAVVALKRSNTVVGTLEMVDDDGIMLVRTEKTNEIHTYHPDVAFTRVVERRLGRLPSRLAFTRKH